ncbi:MAG: quinolinate synthase NadA [Bacteroidales bacterium]|nr:quinolinate synthase NadA [Bacteroidales bacterium]
MFEETIRKKGFLDLPINSSVNIIEEIKRIKKEKNAIILAHFYQESAIQDIADFVGDSLKLAQEAQKTNADIIVMAGVHFMAETAKILCPDKKVLIPDIFAGCSLAESCKADDFIAFKKLHPDAVVVSYVNTTAEIKALTDVVCTSTNAIAIVNSFPKNQKIIFGPDRNLGSYIASQLDRDIIIWDGACTVHEAFSLEKILDIKNSNLDAKIISHPECTKPILLVSDFVGSTSQLLTYAKNSKSSTFIVVTESGILHQMKKDCPDKTFIPAPPNDSTCACNDCAFMKLITLEKLYNTLLYELPEVSLDKDLIEKAKKSIIAMLDISEKNGL